MGEGGRGKGGDGERFILDTLSIYGLNVVWIWDYKLSIVVKVLFLIYLSTGTTYKKYL